MDHRLGRPSLSGLRGTRCMEDTRPTRKLGAPDRTQCRTYTRTPSGPHGLDSLHDLGGLGGLE